jgi:F0F1-type ATP synthase membrane subunit c/vacuolar-type H+-ATPase subunit K
MKNSKAAMAAVLAGGVALASAAYGIGTQAGDGTAEAARDGQAPAEPRLFLRFDGLAEELGVDADDLQDALRAFHEQEKGEIRDSFASALAEALDRPVDEVKAALDEVGPGESMRPGCAPHVSLRRLAAELDVTRAELREALRETRAGVDAPFEEHHDNLVKFLADRFGLSEQKVEEALPEPPDAGERPRFAPPAPPPLGHSGPPRFEPGVLPG